MERVQVETTQNVAIDYEVAGLGDRILAALIDYAILFAYFLGVVLLASAAESLAVFIAGYLPLFFYFLLCEVLLNGQSIGKRLRQVRVVRLDGRQPTLGGYLLRWLLRPIDIDLFAGVVGVTAILVSGRGQRLGDLAAGTTVVRLRPQAQLRDTLFARLEETDYHLTFPQVERLTDADVETAKEVLNALIAEGRSPTGYRLGNEAKAALEGRLHLHTELSPLDFLRTVVRDYNHLKGRL